MWAGLDRRNERCGSVFNGAFNDAGYALDIEAQSINRVPS